MPLDYSALNEKNPEPLFSELTDIPKFSNTLGAVLLTVLIVVITGVLIIPVLLAPAIYIYLKKYISKSGASAIRTV